MIRQNRDGKPQERAPRVVVQRRFGRRRSSAVWANSPCAAI